MTGVGRTGRWFALEHEGLQPDMVVLAKGLAGGYAPLGAVVTTEQIYDTVRQTSGYFLHGFTYAGHPVSLAAGVAVMRIVERERLVENAQCRGEALRAGLDELAARYPHLVKQIRGVGMMQGVVLHPRPGLGDGGAGMLLASLALDEGLIVYPASGTGTTTAGDHLFVAPPLSITEAELDECLELFERSLARMEVQVEGGHMAVPGK
jgi:adenosylmethionine-8-amino-7-oxononanoate aminotransferase